MRRSLILVTAVLMTFASTVWAQRAGRQPRIGYLYPAGGRQGEVFEVIVGGQLLRGAKSVYVTGEGVTAKIIDHYRPRPNLNGEQRRKLVSDLRTLCTKRLAELPQKDRPGWLPGLGNMNQRAGKRKKKKDAEPVEMPKHPLLRDLDNMTLRELMHVSDTFINGQEIKKKQRNAQLGEMVLIEVTIDEDAAPGDRELRLYSGRGVTNPMCFQVGTLWEVREQEPNDPESYEFLPKAEPLEPPVLLNGQIMPGDVDRFRIKALRGQHLVIAASARRLVPYLADAVPGWFQATVAVYDAKGNEVAFADDYQFDPDPVLFYRIPKTGEYELEIRDSIYRGREDFVYRIAVGALPYITQMFPLGGPAGAETVAAVSGWNLNTKRITLDTAPGDDVLRHITWRRGQHVSNELPYAVDTLPEIEEAEPNDDASGAQSVTLPLIVNGRIGQPGDVDVFRFDAQGGDTVVAEVIARRLHSPIDSLLRVIDASGKVIEWNDDYVIKEGFLHKNPGLQTHHADSYLTAKLPESGVYYVHISDTQNHGGDAYAYRLRIGPPRVNFALRVTPSSVFMPAGRAAVLTIHALRKDGFEGEIDLVLHDAPKGFKLSGASIPRGQDQVRVTLTAPAKAPALPVELQIAGQAMLGDQIIRRTAMPCDNVMQAFLYRHLAPSRQLVVTVKGNRWQPIPVQRASEGPVHIPVGGAAEVHVKTHRRPQLKTLELIISDPPAGITLHDAKLADDGLTFRLQADPKETQVGAAGNLIIRAYTQVQDKPKEKGGKKIPGRKRRVPLGVLPAVPYVVDGS